MLVVDFNSDNLETCLLNFTFEINTKNINNSYTCYKNLKNAIFMNSFRTFQSTVTITTALSDFHKMVITALKPSYAKFLSRENFG